MRAIYLLIFFIFIGCGSKSSSISNDSSIVDKEIVSKDRDIKKLPKAKKSVKYDENKRGYYPSEDLLDFKRVIVANSTNFCKKINEALPYTTILLEDGEYSDYCQIKNRSFLTIKAKNKYGVRYFGSYFFLELVDKNHHINIIGIEASGDTTTYDSGLVKIDGYGELDNHHIYIRDCWIHNSGSAILLSPKNHDITIDRCLIHDIKMGYGVYALGWHITLLNSLLYHPENNSFMIRGYFPLNKNWEYNESESIELKNESDIESLPQDEWTHYVVGNFFGKGYNRNAKRAWDRGAAIAFYLGRGNNDGDDCYLPPQNVVIERNSFYDISPSIAPNGDIFEGAILLDYDSGFSKERKSDIEGLIEGTIIRNNRSNVKLLKYFWQEPDLDLIQLSNNIDTTNRDELEREFYKRIDDLKRDSYDE